MPPDTARTKDQPDHSRTAPPPEEATVPEEPSPKGLSDKRPDGRGRKKRKAKGSGRLPALDGLRGLVVAAMALDHARHFLAWERPAEYWGTALPQYEAWLPFLTRLASHLAAPGFFLLMGAAIVLFADRRRAEGWPKSRIVRFLATRGLILIALQLAIVNPAWAIPHLAGAAEIDRFGSGIPGEGGGVLLYFGVLYGLGAAMLAGAALLRFGPAALIGLGVAAIAATHLLMPDADRAAEPFSIVWRLLLIPGETGVVHVNYPLLPWLAVAAFGMALGRSLAGKQARRTIRLAAPAGAALIGLAILLRAVGIGDFHAVEEAGPFGFLNLTKYPPSAAFLLLALGANLLLLAGLGAVFRTRTAIARPLLVFGRSALFFYVAHLYVFALIAEALQLAVVFPLDLAWVYPAWLCGLVLLYPLCRSYGRFRKAKRPGSAWRYL